MLSPIASRCLHALGVVALSIVAAPPATAQDSTPQAGPSAECLPRARRVRDSCDPEQVVVRTESEMTFSIELAPPKVVQCVAAIEISYTQRDTAVAVEGTIANNVCAASSGDYKLLVSVRGTEGLQQLEFMESWQREDSEPVKFSAAYPIGENVDVVRVRPAQSRCTCTEAPAAE